MSRILIKEIKRLDGKAKAEFYRRDDGFFSFVVREERVEPDGPHEGRVYWLPTYESGFYATETDVERDAARMFPWILLIPINFALTETAVEAIQAFVELCRKERDMDDPVAAMCWVINGTDREGNWQELNVPNVGVYERNEIPQVAIQNLNGLELVFSVPHEVSTKFAKPANRLR